MCGAVDLGGVEALLFYCAFQLAAILTSCALLFTLLASRPLAGFELPAGVFAKNGKRRFCERNLFGAGTRVLAASTSRPALLAFTASTILVLFCVLNKAAA